MKVLVVGYGSIGKRHIKNLSKLTKTQVIVLTHRKLDNFLKKNKCQVFSDIHECINLKPDFAIIANSTELHIPTAIILAKHGIHLFIEKPLSNNLKNLKILNNLVSQKKLITLLGSNLRFHPCIKKIKYLLESNKIGIPISAYVENSSYLPLWHKNRDYRIEYAANELKSGGIIFTNIHELDYLCWFFGIPKSIFSLTEKLSNLELDSSDISNMIIKFGNNLTASLHLDFFQKSPFRCCKIVGTKGILYWNDQKNILNFFDNTKSAWSKLMTLKQFNLNQTYEDELSYFISCIKKNQQCDNNLNKSIQILKIASYAKNSSKLKKMVKTNV